MIPEVQELQELQEFRSKMISERMVPAVNFRRFGDSATPELL
jgi:hypothetical protein